MAVIQKIAAIVTSKPPKREGERKLNNLAMAKMVRPAANVRQVQVLNSFLGMSKPTMIKEGNSYKCSLCKKAGDYASLVPHIQTHSRNVLTYKGVQIYRCGLDCCDAPHHHCCFCNKSVVIKVCFIRHLRRCEEDRMEEDGTKKKSSDDQNSIKTTAPSRPLANAPAMGIVVQTSAGPALLQTVASPVRLQGATGASLVLQATHLPLGTSTATPLLLQATTTAASSPKQASTAKTSVEETATTTSSTSTITSTSTIKSTSATTSSPDETSTSPPSPSSPQSPPQTPDLPSMELDTLTDASTDKPASAQPQGIALLLTDALWQRTSVTAPTAEQATTATPTNPTCPPRSAPPADATPEASAPSKRRTTCPHCPTVLFKRNLKVHIFRHHKDIAPDILITTQRQRQQQQQQQQQNKQQKQTQPQQKQKQRLMSIYVDAKNGILAVQRHARGLLAPVHVRKKVRAGQVVRCDLRECHQFQRMAMRHGLTVTSCQHTQNLEHCKETAAEEALSSDVLDEMVTLKHLSEAKRAMCLRRQRMAQTANVPFSVLVDFGGSPRHMFVSVHEPKTSDFCFGRMMVSVNIDRNMWHCPCTKPHLSCFHKNIAKWHIFQTNRDVIEPLEASRTGKGKSNKSNNARSAKGDIKRSVDYLYDQKKVPAELPEDLINALCEFPAHLFPMETTCEVCPHAPGLEESECVTDQAKIVTMLGVADGVCTYMRRCPECQILYRYQEWQDGLHNFDNHLILSTELCLYLRHSLQNQIPLAKAVKTLESLRGVQFPPAEELVNAYAHFEALVSLEDTDSLASAGSSSSSALATELHRKAFLTLHWR